MKRNLQKSLKGSPAVGKPREVVDLNIIFRNVAKNFEVKNMSSWGFDQWIQIVQIFIGLVTSSAIAGWVVWQYKKDNEIKALRNQRDNLQLEIKTMKLYELAVIRKLLVDKEITFPTKSTPNGFRDSLRNLVKVEYYEDDAPHQFPTNSTETLRKYETS